VTIRNLELDGQGRQGDGVKAESGSAAAHHITLDNLFIHGHDADQQIVGISTKCPAWNWVIRRCRITGAGTGIYLGNSDGTQEFVNGLIEHNLVRDSVGYDMQIKHQIGRNTGLGIPASATTIIRHNVFSKAQNASTGDDARPNLLVGHWPPSGPGASDVYQIYGNFFHENPVEALFQGEGNIAFYDNLLLNDFDPGIPALVIQPQNDVVKAVEVFDNTVVSRSRGIRITANAGFPQRAIANAVFAGLPIDAPVQTDNVQDTYGNAGAYLVNPTGPIGAGLSLFPLVGPLSGAPVSSAGLTGFLDWDRDFNGKTRSAVFRGAYDGAGTNPGWPLALAVKPDSADLSITKTDGQSAVTAGAMLTYTIVVSNGGPDPAPGATVADPLPAALTASSWTCVATAGSSCGAASGSGSINQTVTLASGGTIVFALTATVDAAASGSLVNTATVAVPAGMIDAVPANNSATDTDAIQAGADLSITKTDNRATAGPGQAISYTIVAMNAGPNAAAGATVTDTVPAALTGAAWTCVGTSGGTCTAAGTGNINETVNLPAVGSRVTYTLTGTVSPSPTSLRNTATVTPPAGMGDPNPANNSATDVDLLICGGESVVVPDGRLISGVVNAGATVWFGSALKIGDSYSFEVKSLVGTGPIGTLTVFAGDDGCSGTSTLAIRDATNDEPGAGTTSRRLSFTASGAETFHRARLVNSSGASIPYSLSLADTTLYSPAWSTNGAFDTYYSFQNTTAAALNGRLTLLDIAGATLATFDLMVPAGQTAGTNTSALAVARGRAGTARFRHEGPPGAIAIEAAIANFAISPSYVQPVKFQSVRESR
jgi:uncharacterized repeat protein (TIGR01451 family)